MHSFTIYEKKQKKRNPNKTSIKKRMNSEVSVTQNSLGRYSTTPPTSPVFCAAANNSITGSRRQTLQFFKTRVALPRHQPPSSSIAPVLLPCIRRLAASRIRHSPAVVTFRPRRSHLQPRRRRLAILLLLPQYGWEVRHRLNNDRRRGSGPLFTWPTYQISLKLDLFLTWSGFWFFLFFFLKWWLIWAHLQILVSELGFSEFRIGFVSGPSLHGFKSATACDGALLQHSLRHCLLWLMVETERRFTFIIDGWSSKGSAESL